MAILNRSPEGEDTSPRLDTAMTHPALEARSLVKSYPTQGKGIRRGAKVHAVRNVSLVVPRGKTVGIVGESGCGKSTLARMLVGLEEPSSGQMLIAGEELRSVSGKRRRQLLRRVQMVFQSPFTSLDPRMKVGSIVREPLDIARPRKSRRERTQAVKALMDQVGLNQELRHRYPHELSGGQQQRVGLARSLGSGCEVVICDEPVSALDVSIQAQVVNLLQDIQSELEVAYVFIAHNLSVVATISDFIAVMYLGQVVEYGPTDAIFESPLHPYTKALLSSAPVPDPELDAEMSGIVLEGDLPSPERIPSGCSFRSRCWKAQDICSTSEPTLDTAGDGAHRASCFFPETTQPGAEFPAGRQTALQPTREE